MSPLLRPPSVVSFLVAAAIPALALTAATPDAAADGGRAVVGAASAKVDRTTAKHRRVTRRTTKRGRVVRARTTVSAPVALSPASGLPLTSVKVNGSGYARRTSGAITFAGSRVATFKTSNQGTFTASFTVPGGAAAGSAAVVATAGTIAGSTSFTVLAAPSPAATPAPTPTPTPIATPTPTPIVTPTPTYQRAETRPIGSATLSDAEAAARVRRSTWEPRADNADENRRVPTASELSSFLSASGSWGTCGERYRTRVTGNFTGTTDEIIQWAAHKWGIDEDLARAQVVKESWWYMSTAGDGGISYGLTQIKSTVNPGTAPLSQISTAFNMDYWGALMRNHYDGCSAWLNTVERGQQYVAGDIWGAVGTWYAGRWHTPDAESYIAAVKDHLARRTWATPGF